MFDKWSNKLEIKKKVGRPKRLRILAVLVVKARDPNTISSVGRPKKLRTLAVLIFKAHALRDG